MKKTSITPAILQQSFSAIKETLERVRGVSKQVQIDIVDGVHAPDATWPFVQGEDGTGHAESLTERELADRAECLHEVRVPFELDLMVHSPEDSLGVWLITDATRFIIHHSSTQYISYCLNRVKEDGREVYLALTVHDVFEKVAPLLETVDGVQCMGIEHVGKQGEPYTDRIEGLIEAIRGAQPTLPIQVDGGVSAQILPRLLELGVTQVVVGSALLKGDVEENFAALQGVLR